MYYLGIDIAKTNHVAAIVDQDGKVVLSKIKFTNSNEGYQYLLDNLVGIANKDNLMISLEATGHYWLALYSALVKDDFKVVVFNPLQIKSYRSAFSLRKQKNDCVDAVMIADYLRVFGPNDSKLPDEGMLELKQLTRYRSNLVESVATIKTQIIGILDKIFPEYSSLFVDTFGATSKQVLQNCPTPDDVLSISTTKLTNVISKASKGRFGKIKALEIKSLAKNTFGIKYASNACSFEIKQMLNQLAFLEIQVDEVQEQIDILYKTYNVKLTSIPGIGDKLAPIILAEIGDINNFDKPSKLTAFAGIDPSENQSGQKSSSNEKTSKSGSPHLRHAIYTASLVAMTHDSDLRAYYNKKKNEGKHHFVALTGISRKLLHIIFHVLKNDREYYKPGEKPTE